MRVEVWSDVVCPWCYIGKRRLERALEQFAHRDQTEVVWRSFELDPDAPAAAGGLIDRLASRYGVSRGEAEAMNARVSDIAAADGLPFQLDRARPGNTFDAHRLIHLAAEHGAGHAAKERLLAAYFTEGLPIGDRETLVSLGVDVGLEEDAVRLVLESGRYGDDVRADEREATALGITGVPFFVLDRRYGVSGAQPAEALLGALNQAWAEQATLPSGAR